jgi:hypothetical protein
MFLFIFNEQRVPKFTFVSVLIFMPVYLVVGQENSLLAHVVTVINLKVSILVYEYR